MNRSERLAKEGKVGVCVGSFETATVIPHCNAKRNIRYIGTDFDCLYDGKEVNADVYEDEDGNMYAVINPYMEREF